MYEWSESTLHPRHPVLLEAIIVSNWRDGDSSGSHSPLWNRLVVCHPRSRITTLKSVPSYSRTPAANWVQPAIGTGRPFPAHPAGSTPRFHVWRCRRSRYRKRSSYMSCPQHIKPQRKVCACHRTETHDRWTPSMRFSCGPGDGCHARRCRDGKRPISANKRSAFVRRGASRPGRCHCGSTVSLCQTLTPVLSSVVTMYQTSS